ncbi:MAG: TlpA disulfide reductase family protein [Acidobacteriaceae bacterium]
MHRFSSFPLRIVALGAVIAAGCAPACAQQSLLNRRAPEFSRSDLRGAHIDLAQYRGKVVLLNFWATWCGPCRIEMPRFIQWQKTYAAQGLQVLGVSIDDSVAPVGPFVQKLQVNYPVVMGDAHLGDLYGGVYGVPVTFLIDRQGIVRARFDGEPDLGALESAVQKLLASH